MISPGRPCESRDPTTGVSLAKNASSTSFNRGHNAVWVPGRAEPVIGPAEGRTRWLARDDVGVRLPIQMSYSDADKPPRSRGAMRPSFASISALAGKRGRRESRVPIAPVGPVQKKHGGRTTGSTGNIRLSLRDGL